VRLLATITLALISAQSAVAQMTLFFDDFNGPTLNSAFQAYLPTAGQGDLANNVTYSGAPNYAFQTLGGSSVLRLTNTLNNLQRVGWSTNTVFNVPNFSYEIRFNTLVQSPTTSIDAFVEGWLLNANDPTQWAMVEPCGANYSISRQFRAATSIGPSALTVALNYQNNTWYRLVIQGAAGQDVRASIFADDGVTELAGQTFGYTPAVFASGFRLGLSQAMGLPGAAYPMDVAIDWIRLTTTAVPEPSALALTAAAGICVANKRLRNRRRQGSRNKD
jgi:hypothetical protein